MDADSATAVAAKPRRLGRGLSSLLNIAVPVEVAAPLAQHIATQQLRSDFAPGGTAENELYGLIYVPLASITTSPFQPRRSIDEAALGALAQSIKRAGVLQPVLVRRVGGGGGYELVAGERRWRAAKLAGLSTVPAIVRELKDEEAAEHALVENVQREDLNAMERAWALRGLSERFGLSHAQLAERVGLERPTIANLIRLTELEPEIAGMIAAGRLSAGHGKALLAVVVGEPRLALATRAAAGEWSVRVLEQAAATLPKAAPANPNKKGGRDDPRLAVLADLQRRIGQQLGTKVVISTDRAGKRGRIAFDFYGLDHFDALMAKLGIQTQ